MEPDEGEDDASKIVYNESQMSTFEITRPSPKRKRRVLGRTAGSKVCHDEENLVPATDSEDCQESDEQKSERYDSSDQKEEDDGMLTSPQRKRKKKSGKSLSCEHCGKTFTKPWGLKYHVNNLVCRRKAEQQGEKEETNDDQKAEPGKVKKRKRGKSLPKGESKQKRNRGKAEDRTCNDCGRVFTSVLGLQYHAKNKVCKGTKGKGTKGHNSRTAQKMACHALTAGEEFVTPFGVVRVVKDDRAVPIAVATPKDVAKINLAHRKATTKFETSLERYRIRRHAQLRFRRQKINNLYANNNVSQRSVFGAYQDADPEQMNTLNQIADPFNPADAFPDRIVECLWIADKRKYHDEDGDEIEMGFHELEIPMKLFLRRRLLNEPYSEDGDVYGCEHCNRKFCSQPSWKYHFDNKPCQNTKASMQGRKEEAEKKIAKAVAILRRRETGPSKQSRNDKRKHKPVYGIYPEAMITLGFKFVAKESPKRPLLLPRIKMDPEIENTSLDGVSAELTAAEGEELTAPSAEETARRESSAARATRTKRKEPPKSKPIKDEDPKLVLLRLQQEAKAIHSEIDAKRYGSMYPNVYESLGFYFPGTFPRVERNIIRFEKKAPKKKKKRKRKVPPLAPFVDPKALVDEVLSGRYPSMKPFEGSHMSVCSMCKQGSGDILCCSFCKNVEHMACLRTKFTTKAPEPGETFMCHKCTGTIIWKRNRAEKRRTNAYAKEDKAEDEKDEDQEMETGDNTRSQDYHLVAESGRETMELVELLKDSRVRLKQSAREMEMNNLRRRMMFD